MHKTQQNHFRFQSVNRLKLRTFVKKIDIKLFIGLYKGPPWLVQVVNANDLAEPLPQSVKKNLSSGVSQDTTKVNSKIRRQTSNQ